MLTEQPLKYFSDITVDEYFKIVKDKFPYLYNLLDKERFSGENIEQIFSQMKIIDFEGDAKGGRGKDYFIAQNEYPLNRQIGFRSILNLIASNDGEEKKKVLDILGGNGTLYRAAKLMKYDNLQIIINDISEEMIENAFSQKIPCIRQPAQNLLLKSDCLDAVIFAYGTHHIPMEERVKAFAETKRVLKNDGIIIFHDYAEGSITSKWYSEVLHKYTYTGHDFIHFYKDQLKSDLEKVGFSNVKSFYNYDPFVIEGETPELAKKNLLDHLISLFGLKKFSEKYQHNEELYYAEAEKMIRHYSDFTNVKDEEINNVIRLKELSVYADNNTFYAEMPRFSLMATGVCKGNN